MPRKPCRTTTHKRSSFRKRGLSVAPTYKHLRLEESKMPDGSTFGPKIAYAQHQSATPEPVITGLVTLEEWTALQRHFAAMQSPEPTRGPADFAALQARAILHDWAGSGFTIPGHRNSVHFWQLVAFFEGQWVEKRRNRRKLPHEKAAAVLLQRGRELNEAKSDYYKVSRFRRTLAAKCGDNKTVEMIDECPREKRRELIVEARRRWRPAFRTFLEAVDAYRLLRTVHDTPIPRRPGRTFGTHMMRVPDGAMAPAYEAGEWLGVIRRRRPKKDSDFLFIDDHGAVVLGKVLGWTAKSWRIGQYHGEPRHTVRRLSRKRWQAAWRVCSRFCRDEGYYDAVALGMTDRAKAIQLALGGRCEMPPPLSAGQLRAVPRIVKMRP